jgi:hypothetical protein
MPDNSPGAVALVFFTENDAQVFLSAIDDQIVIQSHFKM